MLGKASRLTRRSFLVGAVQGGLGAYLAWAGGLFLPWTRPGIAHGADLAVLSDKEAEAMLAMTRQLYPHPGLGNRFYWVVVEGIDKEMSGNADLAARIRQGFASMGEVFGIEFRELSKGNQIRAMKEVEDTPFFSDMLSKTTYYFYDNSEVWPYFGYEGSSWEHGGYIDGGFNDADWVPEA